MAPTADPVREDVEATLRRLVGVATTGPCGLMRAARRVVIESVGLARTMINLTVDGLLGWEVDSGVPRLETVPAPAGRTRVVDGPGDSVSIAAGDRTGADDLAIAGYEGLAASHIVARLDRLTPAELVDVRTFEVANRGRRTVVGKIDQLLARTQSRSPATQVDARRSFAGAHSLAREQGVE